MALGLHGPLLVVDETEIWIEFQKYLRVMVADWDPRARSLVLMIQTGIYSKNSYQLSSEFQSLGILHLLVLSGSQVSYLARAVEDILGFVISGLRWVVTTFGRRLRLSHEVGEWNFQYAFATHSRRILDLCQAGVIWVFVAGSGWDAPLTRAGLLFWIGLRWPHLKLIWKIGLGLGFQVLLFPEHLEKIGFYLSWICFAIVVLCSRLPYVAEAVLTSALCVLASYAMLGRGWELAPFVREWIANILFAFWIFPMLRVGAFWWIMMLGSFLISRIAGQLGSALGLWPSYLQILDSLGDGIGVFALWVQATCALVTEWMLSYGRMILFWVDTISRASI